MKLNPDGSVRDIFEGISQDIEIDPASIRPIQDRVLVRDVGEGDQIGSIFVPQVAQDKAQLRIGVVVAIGPGDSWIELGLDAQGDPRRRPVKVLCQTCWGCGYIIDPLGPPFHLPCQPCGGTGKACRFFDIRKYEWIQPRLPMPVKPGDRVVFDRRLECRIFINKCAYYLIHAEQSIFGVLEEDQACGS